MVIEIEDTEEDRTARNEMVDRLIRTGRCERVSTEAAMRAVPRHVFVSPDQRDVAYQDRPLPIGDGQTISAPHMVAMMVDLLDLEPGEKVLEIGTGCGYHAAVTAEVVGDENMCTMEVSERLAKVATERLTALGYDAITVTVGDGSNGWPEHAPFDGIYLTCATESIPDPLIEQLADGGRLLGPVGSFYQELVSVTKEPDGDLLRERHGGVRFVRMR